MNEASLASWLNQTTGFTHRHRPLVTLSYAQSLDGCISEVKGRSTLLSGDSSARATHMIRAGHDGILVGIGTVVSDNPRLSVRLVEGQNPRPIIIDTHLRIPLDSKLLNSGILPLIFCAADKLESGKKRLGRAAADLVGLKPNREGRLNLPDILSGIENCGISKLMVEGGGDIISSFLNSKLWDRAAITITPKWLAGYAPSPRVGSAPELQDVRWIPAGEDIMCLGRRAE